MVRAKVVTRIAGVVLSFIVIAAHALSTVDAARARSPITANLSAPITCANTPFGRAMLLANDLEPMLLLDGSGGDFFEEYNPSGTPSSTGVPANWDLSVPLVRSYRATLGTTRTLRKAVSVDFNGDGRDEVVEALSSGPDVQLIVYQRSGPAGTPSPTVSPVSTWTFTEPVIPGSISLVSGDLDGSKDRRKEIAASWIVGGAGGDAGKVHVVVLTGNGIAHFAQANNVAGGNFVTTAAGLKNPQLAVADFLLQGRDELALTAYDQTTGNVSIDLLEYDHGSSITTVLPTVGNSMRGAHFTSALGGDGKFHYDGGTQTVMTTVAGIGVIEDLRADGGDVVDTPTAELVLQVMFARPTAPIIHEIAARVLHFTTTRDVNNTITSVSLSAPNPYGDSSVRILAQQDPAPKFATAVADVDGIERKEIVTALLDHDLVNPQNGKLGWQALKVHAKLQPKFFWQNAGSNVVDFLSTSVGEIKAYSWDFGDGSTSDDQTPVPHTFTSTGTYSVTLTTRNWDDTLSAISHDVTVTSQAGAAQGDLVTPPWAYLIDSLAPLTLNYVINDFSYSTAAADNTIVKVSVGDLDQDGMPEVVLAVNSVDPASHSAIAVDTFVYFRRGDGYFDRGTTHLAADSGNSAMEMVLSDFDGDAVNIAVGSDAVADCRNVHDTRAKSLTWVPPFFELLQGELDKEAEYGKSSSNSTSSSQSTESSYSNSVTGYVGFEKEFKVPVLDIKLADITVKAEGGYEWQTSDGEEHETEDTTSIDESVGVGFDALGAQGVIAAEDDGSNCYSYDVVTSAGVIPNSKMRLCSVAGKPTDESFLVSNWNELALEQRPIEVPIHWVPMQRDWASIAMFHPVSAGSSNGGLTMISGHEASNATDGLFTTDAESSISTTDPYLQVDLGSVKAIWSVRVFPSANAHVPDPTHPLDFNENVPDLNGYRLYASATPFNGNGLPTADDGNNFVADGISTFVQDIGVDRIYRAWNIWTGSPNDNPSEPLRARYLRVQKPTNGQPIGNIRISEIQVFGESHTDPQYFPDGVCDPVLKDGLFKATVFDNVHRLYTTIQVRGDLLWSGAVDLPSTYDGTGTNVPSCSNDANIPHAPIWQNKIVLANSELHWNFSSENAQTNSTSHTQEDSFHVGAEFETKFGTGMYAVIGGSYEHTGGVTTETQSRASWSTGFEVGGLVVGPDADKWHSLASTCGYYYPRPYAFQVTNYADSGWKQNTYVTDYIVRQHDRRDDASVWQRDKLPSGCSNQVFDRIFADGFGFHSN